MRILAIVLLSVIVIAACRGGKYTLAEITINCTGTYLAINGKYYHVCNVDKLGNKANRDVVKVIYNRISQCHDASANNPVCFMNFASSGWIEIEKIK
jgi:hypothetical protein